MSRIRSHLSHNLNLNTLLIAVVAYFLKTSLGKLDTNNDLVQREVVRVQGLEQRVDKLETVQGRMSRDVQRALDKIKE